MHTALRIINNSTVFGLLARVSHGRVNVSGFTLRAQQGNQDTEFNASVGQRGIYFYDDFTHQVVGNVDITLVQGTNTQIQVAGTPGNLTFAVATF